MPVQKLLTNAYKFTLNCKWCGKKYKSRSPYGFHARCTADTLELTDADIEAIQSNTYAWAYENYGLNEHRVVEIKGGVKRKSPWRQLTEKDKKNIPFYSFELIAKKYNVSTRTARKWKKKLS